MVTPSNVKAILPTDLTDEDLQAFIDGATELVTATLAGALSDSLTKEITCWLTAHMLASTREQQMASAGAGGATVKYQGVYGLGLDGTMYGQHVKILDTTGKLAALGGKGSAYIFAVES
jgi:hypothetical protein